MKDERNKFVLVFTQVLLRKFLNFYQISQDVVFAPFPMERTSSYFRKKKAGHKKENFLLPNYVDIL